MSESECSKCKLLDEIEGDLLDADNEISSLKKRESKYQTEIENLRITQQGKDERVTIVENENSRLLNQSRIMKETITNLEDDVEELMDKYTIAGTENDDQLINLTSKQSKIGTLQQSAQQLKHKNTMLITKLKERKEQYSKTIATSTFLNKKLNAANTKLKKQFDDETNSLESMKQKNWKKQFQDCEEARKHKKTK